ncbi:MAG: N-acetylmuramoyl-L-alanine amidase [Hyphomicrobiaceae bacterium]|nr:N-acetylmuramoyl-L-alanine amidase [Hyphomicrobiaceae bacterium]
MTDTADSALVTLFCPSPNFEPRKGNRAPDLLLLHYTGMESAEGALAWLTTEESKVSCHYLVDEEGRITQMVREEARAWHAGVSHWAGEEDINSCSIGIEIHNPGHELGYPDFPEEQMVAVEALCVDILQRHAIPPQRVLAHSDVAPGRKADPGEKFDWRRLADAGVGLWVEPEPVDADTAFAAGEKGESVATLQRDLQALGYGIDESGVYDNATTNVVRAFQRHWRQIRIDGCADASTRETVVKLLNALPSTV